MPGSIFDDSFQTAIPQLDTKAIWTANLLRDKARSLDGVLTSLDKIGKVFTDAEDNLKKANTASLGNYLKSMPWDQRIALEQAGFNPAVLLAQNGVPVDISSAELNKASQDSYAAARKDKTANWVTTMLPRISQQDWVDYMMGKRPNLFRDYGMDATMDFANNEDLRQDVQAARKAAANLFVKSFDADHKINPIDAVKRGMTIDEWRWSVASPEERSVLAQADKDYSDKPQEYATAVANALRTEIDTGKTAEEKASASVLDDNLNETHTARKNLDPMIKQILEEAAPEYIKFVQNPLRNKGDYKYIPFSEYVSEDYGLDDSRLTPAIREQLKVQGETFDLKPFWGRDTIAALPGLDHEGNITVENLEKFYKRFERTNPEEFKRQHDQYITNNAERLKQTISEEDIAELTKPSVNLATVQGIRKKYVDPYERAYSKNASERWHFKNNVEPTWDRVFKDYMDKAKVNEDLDKQIRTRTNADATWNLNQNRLVKLAGGDTSANVVDGKSILMSESAGKLIKNVKAELIEVMPSDVQEVYNGLNDEGKRMLLALTLAWLGDGSFGAFAHYSEKDQQQEILKLKGRKNADLDLPYREAVKQIQAMQPYDDKHNPAQTAEGLKKMVDSGQ